MDNGRSEFGDREIDDKRVYIKNIPKTISHDDVRSFLNAYNLKIGQVYLSNKSEIHSDGFAYVQFVKAEDATKAIEILNGENLGGNALKVSVAYKMSPRQKKGFDY